MLIAALFGVIGSAFGGGLFWGIAAGVLSAVVVSVLFAYFHLVLKANSVLCGTAINTIAAGLTVFVLQLLTGEKGSSSSLNSFQFPTLNIPIIENIPVLGRIPIRTQHSYVYGASNGVFNTSFFLSHTHWTSYSSSGRDFKGGRKCGN